MMVKFVDTMLRILCLCLSRNEIYDSCVEVLIKIKQDGEICYVSLLLSNTLVSLIIKYLYLSQIYDSLVALLTAHCISLSIEGMNSLNQTTKPYS